MFLVAVVVGCEGGAEGIRGDVSHSMGEKPFSRLGFDILLASI